MILTQNLEAEISFRHARYKCESFQIGLLIACLAAFTSLKISGKVTLRGKRRLTADSVHMGAGNSLSHYMGMRGHFPGNDFV